MKSEKILEYLLPAGALFVGLLAWEFVVRQYDIQPFLLPSPSLILATLYHDWPMLYGSLLVTLRITFEGLLAAIVGGVALAVLFSQSRLIERAFFPYAVIMQVTPIIAIAPLLLVYLSASTAVLVVSFLVARRKHSGRYVSHCGPSSFRIRPGDLGGRPESPRAAR